MTFQDRLVSELRRARATDLASANAILRAFLPRFNQRFAVPAASEIPDPAAVTGGARSHRGVCVPLASGRRPRTVASGSTGWSSSCRLARAAARSPAGGSNSSSGSTAAVPAPPEPARLREVRVLASGGPSPEPNSRNVGNRPGDDHPWRRISPGFKLARARRVDRPLTDSLSS